MPIIGTKTYAKLRRRIVRVVLRLGGVAQRVKLPASDHIRNGIVKLRRLRELRRFAGPDEAYRHNDVDVCTVNVCDGECANGHAHCQHLLLGAAVTLPASEGKLLLGLWQRIFLVELDRPARATTLFR